MNNPDFYEGVKPEHVAEHEGRKCRCPAHNPRPFTAPTKSQYIDDGQFYRDEQARDQASRENWRWMAAEAGESVQPLVQAHFCTFCGQLLGMYMPKPIIKPIPEDQLEELAW